MVLPNYAFRINYQISQTEYWKTNPALEGKFRAVAKTDPDLSKLCTSTLLYQRHHRPDSQSGTMDNGLGKVVQVAIWDRVSLAIVSKHRLYENMPV